MVLMMRTLRDMNLSKLIAEDVPLFLSLIADLFPGLTAAKVSLDPQPSTIRPKSTKLQPLILIFGPSPSQTPRPLSVTNTTPSVRYKHHALCPLQTPPPLSVTQADFPEITTAMRKAADQAVLQYDAAPEWSGKCIQLLETYYVRHGIGVVGPTGAGKTTMTETLAAGLSAIDVKHVLLRMNPKAITAPQMFGRMDPSTGDWTDGVFSVLWRKVTAALDFSVWGLGGGLAFSV